MGNRHKKKEEDKSCPFCDILSKKSNEVLLHEDDLVFAFDDINQASSQRHILICPKKHIRDTAHLENSDIFLVQELEKIGRMLLSQSHPGKKYRFGYHAPPNNSINHLHLHGFVLPLTKWSSNYINYGYRLTSSQSIEKQLASKIAKQK